MRFGESSNWAQRLAARPGDEPDIALEDGSRVAVIGGGPAGSLFSYFLLTMAETVDLALTVDIFEPRSFTHSGPGGCNHCGGIVSESLVQLLAAEGINLPPTVVQRGIDAYVVHMDVGSVRIASPGGEQRIAAVYRGNGPRGSADMPWESFDGHLQQKVVDLGARVVPELVTAIDWASGIPRITTAGGKKSEPYDLVVVASGVNSNLLPWLRDHGQAVSPPSTLRTYIREFRSSREQILKHLGTSMHVFLLDLPGLEFAAIIPKGDYITLCILGEGIDDDLVNAFLDDPAVRRVLPEDAAPGVCQCAPFINLNNEGLPFADRIVMIGDAGVTRLYKDGIGAAYRTAKAAAETAILIGVGAREFREHYLPQCRSIQADNRIGKLIFAMTVVFKKILLSRRAILRMTRAEQANRRRRLHMSLMLWNLFTGSAPYREILVGALHPGFATNLIRHLLGGLWPASDRAVTP